MEIIPLGAAGTVTGSRFLVTAGGTRILVDCGLFQGLKQLRRRNWEPFPAEPGRLDAVVLTHAHLDHSGYLPVLVREGFRGPIVATGGTADLTRILLADAGRLNEEDAGWAAKKGFSKHDPPLPLFDEEDARRASEQLRPLDFGEEERVGALTLRLTRAGHLVGAASVKIEDRTHDSVLFSGDLGRRDDALHPEPDPRPGARRLVMESTYGDRSHPRVDAAVALATAVRSAVDRGGVAMVPSFAVGRAQVLMLLLDRLVRAGEIPEVPVFLNSPMAIRATDVHLEHAEELRPPEREIAQAFERVERVESVEESKAVNRRHGPMIVIAGAGMLTGGRILHHLVAFGQDERNTLVLAGYQAEGTRGRDLLRGERRLRIHGRWVPIRCRVERLDVLSGHADREELLEWAWSGQVPEAGAFLVHGEPGAADHLRRRLQERSGWSAQAAEERRPLPELTALEA